jgi:hypothetical protein
LRKQKPGIGSYNAADALFRLVFVFVLFAVKVDVVTGETAADEQDCKNSEPAEGTAVPSLFSGHCGRRGFHRREGCAHAEDQLDVPGHQIEMGLASHLAPQFENR